MKIRFWRILETLAVIFFVGLLIFAIPTFYDPEFEVINNSTETVSVTALWRDQEKLIGSIPPATASQFSVDDEAAMVFRVAFEKGKIIESEPKYFSKGMKVIATITNGHVEVRYGFETEYLQSE